MVKVRKADGNISKTVVWNSLLATLSAAVPLIPQLAGVIPAEWYPWILVAVTLSNVFLRQITSQAMG